MKVGVIIIFFLQDQLGCKSPTFFFFVAEIGKRA